MLIACRTHARRTIAECTADSHSAYRDFAAARADVVRPLTRTHRIAPVSRAVSRVVQPRILTLFTHTSSYCCCTYSYFFVWAHVKFTARFTIIIVNASPLYLRELLVWITTKHPSDLTENWIIRWIGEGCACA